MKKKTLLFLVLLITCSALIIQCENTSKNDLEKTGVIKPVPLPVVINGFHFPEDSNLIYKWVNDSKYSPTNYDSSSIYQHAWGIWAGLTDPTQQVYAGDSLLVFETWMGLNEIREAIEKNISVCDSSFTKTARATLTRPKQYEHAANFALQNASKFASSKKGPKIDRPTENSFTQWVTVSYSPSAACYATNTQIFKQSAINKYYAKDGIGQIPVFPNTAVTIKPTYLVYHDSINSLLRMPVWLNAPNPPDSVNVSQFTYCVYIDIKNQQKEGKKLVPVLQTDTVSADIAKATCNLKDFISFRVDKKMADLMNQQDSVQGMNNVPNKGYGKAKAGELAVLVGMHVTTKEIAKWTWQTFFWTPDPENPGIPSSQLAVKTRPSGLKGAAAHYAANAAYVMLTPNDAVNTTKNAGPMFGYNPYLEGGFGPTTFGLTNNFNPNYKFGMQTNCMNCHALAVPQPPGTGQTFGQYSTDQYIHPYQDSLFKNQVKLDFAWSIQTAIINDTIPYWKFKSK